METASVTSPSSSATAGKQAQLRGMIDEVVGVTFFAPMLQTARNSAIKGKYGHGGRGEEVFKGQLDLEFARNVGRGIQTDLADALYRKFGRQVQA